MFLQFPQFISVYHWSTILSSVRFLPAGIATVIGAGLSAGLARFIDAKYTISIGLVFTFIATILLALANQKGRYWSYVFPAEFMCVV